MNSTNTSISFKDKWENNQDLGFSETLRPGSDLFNWILIRNGFVSISDFQSYLSDKKRILDAGCGNGRVTALLRQYSNVNQTHVMGVDLVAAHVAAANLATQSNVSFYQKDLLGDLSDLGKFDFIYSQEVLHHTSDPRQAFFNLVKLLESNGEIAIYVYKQKAPIREFVDDYIRNQISHLSYKDALIVCNQITEFGKALSELNIKVTVPAVDVLKIEAGEYDFQRLIYHFFMKCFWNPNLSFADNSVINYDWYHPQLATRHTIEEIREWFNHANLKIVHEYVDFYGITMRGLRLA